MTIKQKEYDAIIIGAGASGIMCAINAGKRGRKVLILDHADKIGSKILISGGGKCNFTNLNITKENYISENPNFCLSALKNYTQHDFINLVKKHNISFHEKILGQIFCDKSSKQIIDMLIHECETSQIKIKLNCNIKKIEKKDSFIIQTNKGEYKANSLIIATGGLSIPKMGATNFAYNIAKQFNIPVTNLRPALVPLLFDNDILKLCKTLSGVSLEVKTTIKKISFREKMLFTHKGLSGPAILQISSYWKENQPIKIDLLPNLNVEKFLLEQKEKQPKDTIKKILSEKMPARLAKEKSFIDGSICEISNKNIHKIAKDINEWTLIPSRTDNYEKSEVTLGGISTHALSSKTMETKNINGLYFIGESIDVTGWLGGYNLQWAWSSGAVAGNYV